MVRCTAITLCGNRDRTNDRQQADDRPSHCAHSRRASNSGALHMGVDGRAGHRSPRLRNARIPLPVALKIASQKAADIGGAPGSPTPCGGAALWHDVDVRLRYRIDACYPIVSEVRLLRRFIA